MPHHTQISLFDFDQPFDDAASPEATSSGSSLRSVTSPAELDKLLGSLRKGDTMVVWYLDRLGRSLKDLVSIIAQLKEMGVSFTSGA